jgi:regulator of cell morphogenesis and NO signaling
MNMTAERTVRELALENTAATRVFEALGIDYCCGGNKSLEDACRASNLSVDQVIDSLEMAEEAAHATQKDRNWQIEPLADLITHIKNTHHKFTREELARLFSLPEKVCSVHGKNHPELQEVRATPDGACSVPNPLQGAGGL